MIFYIFIVLVVSVHSSTSTVWCVLTNFRGVLKLQINQSAISQSEPQDSVCSVAVRQKKNQQKPCIHKQKSYFDTPRLSSQTKEKLQNPYVHEQTSRFGQTKAEQPNERKTCKNLTYISKNADLDTPELNSQTKEKPTKTLRT